jgi:acyl-CoA synthetase (AMP-forming)/AMP-acid ligase II
MGLIGMALQTVYAGIQTTIMSPAAFLQRPIRWLQAISRTRATTSAAPNFAYDLCVRKITPEQKAELDLSNWTTAFNGAEPIRQETMERFAEAFAPCGFRPEAFTSCYGLAEAVLLVTGGRKEALPTVCTLQTTALAQNQVVVTGSNNTTEPEKSQTFVGCGRAPASTEIMIVNPESCIQCPPD